MRTFDRILGHCQVFKRFERTKLDELLRKFPVSAEGLRYIESALAAPSRNVQGTTRNVIAGTPNPKMGCTLQSESITGERPQVLQKTFDPDCIGLITQPDAVEIIYQGKGGKKVRTLFRPDCIAFYESSGIVVEEWHATAAREALVEAGPGKYCVRANGSLGSEPIEAAFRPMGISFKLRFADEIDATAHRNWQFLYTYLQPAAEQKYIALLSAFLEFLQGGPQHSIGDLIERGADRDTLYWAIATGRIFFDFGSVPLATQAAQGQVFSNESTFKAWCAAVRPDGSQPRVGHESRCASLQPGDVMMLDGCRLTIKFIGHTGVITRDDMGRSSNLDFAELEQAHRLGKLTLPDATVRPSIRSRFYTANPASLSRATRYAAILEKLDDGVALLAEERYSPATIRRWRKEVREGLSRGLSPVESLIDNIAKRGFRGPHILQSTHDKLNADILKALKNRLDKSLLTIFGDIEDEWEKAGLAMVAKSTFYEHVKQVKSPATVGASKGHKAAHKIEPAHWILSETTPLHGEHAMAWVHIDSTLLDVEIRSSLSGEIIGRPWLTVAICANTRKIVGFHLSFLPPSYISSMMVLADIIRRTGRLPDAVIHDWGSEFKAKDFKECLSALFIERFVRPKGSPRFGSVVERVIGITTQELIHNTAGNTKARKEVRSMSPSADPKWHSGLWLLDLYLGLEDYFFGIYNTRKHSATLMSPDDAFEHSLIMQGRRLHRLRRLDDILPVIAPVARGRTRVLDPTRGLYINYRYYSNPALTDFSHKAEELVVRPIPFDPGHILTFFKGEWISCRTPLAPEVANSPEVVRRCLYEEWSIEQKLVNSSSDDARKKTRDLIEELNERARSNNDYWKERKYKEVLKQTVFPTSEAIEKSTDNTKKLDAFSTLMANAMNAASSAKQTGRLEQV